MNTEKNKIKKSFWGFILPSLVGCFCFLIPLGYSGKVALLITHVADALWYYSKAGLPRFVLGVLVFTAGVSLVTKLWQPNWIKENAWLRSVYVVSSFLLGMRVVAALLALMVFFKKGSVNVYGTDTGGFVLVTLLPKLLINLSLATLLSPFLLDFGLLEFTGVLMTPIMRPLFQLPGAAAVNCITSWVGDGTSNATMIIQGYKQGRYTIKEASVIIAAFSAVSISFCVLLLEYVGLQSHFKAFYGTVTLSGFVVALLLPRTPPLAGKPNMYIATRKPNTEKKDSEKGSIWYRALQEAMAKASRSGNVATILKKALFGIVEVALSVLPGVMVVGTLGLMLAYSSYTKPVLAFLGKPFIPLLTWFGIPEAAQATHAFFIGFVDMFIPAILAAKDITAPITRFVISALSVTQVIYLSELGQLLLRSPLRFSFKDLLFIFLLRTCISLPVILVCARLTFG